MSESAENDNTIDESRSGTDPVVVLLLGGLAFLIVSMVAGEIFAFFISHHFNADINALWSKVLEEAAAGRLSAMDVHFEDITALATGRAGVMSFHAHIAGFGLLCGALAVAMERTGFRFQYDLGVCSVFVFGAALHVMGILLGYLTDLQSLGLAHLGSLFMFLALCVAGVALYRSRNTSDRFHASKPSEDATAEVSRQETLSWHRPLVHAGAFVGAAGVVFGVYLAGSHLLAEEPRLHDALAGTFQALHERRANEAARLFGEFKTIQTRMAITAAAHTHAASFGLLLIILGLMMHRVLLPVVLRRIGVALAIAGAVGLPIFVYMAPRYGFGLAMGANTSGIVLLAGTLLLTAGVVAQLVRETRR